ncbi:MAG: hypothetical protein APF84_01285 [Gracilibacter sp. BRH_c7a]|nr:MAG: hypothetical protein APF84_01285 [Gracilibacter sp. BRH_c7a]
MAACKERCEMVNFCRSAHGAKKTIDNNLLFQNLYELNYPKIFQFLYLKTNHDWAAAEDLTQETFTKAYQHLNRVTYNCNIKNWLFSIASNTLRDHWRRSNNLHQEPLDVNTINLRTTEGLPCDDLIESELRHKFRYIFNTLPPNYRRALCLHECESYSYAQAADIMKMSLTTYTSLINRARIKLKEIVIAHLFSIDNDQLSKSECASISKLISSWMSGHQLCDDVSEPIKHNMRDYFDDHAEQYNKSVCYDYHDLIDDHILGKYPLNQKHLVADFGMGTGIFTANLSRYVQKAHGYDFSERMCAIARDNFRRDDINNVECKNKDFLMLGKDSPQYDYAYCITVLHHLPYPQEAVNKMAATLKRGGCLVISDLHKHKCAEMVEERKDLWYGFTKEQFIKYLTNAGLKNVWAEVHPKLFQAYQTKSGKIAKIATIIGGGEK